MRARLKGQGGFTLIELMAVLFILAVSTAVVGISLGRSLDKSRVRQEVTGVRNLLAFARDQALTNRRPVTFFARADQGSYGLREERSLTLGRGLKFKYDADVVFFPKGDSTGGEVVLIATEGRGYRVLVDPVTGEARIERL